MQEAITKLQGVDKEVTENTVITEEQKNTIKTSIANHVTAIQNRINAVNEANAQAEAQRQAEAEAQRQAQAQASQQTASTSNNKSSRAKGGSSSNSGSNSGSSSGGFSASVKADGSHYTVGDRMPQGGFGEATGTDI